MAQLQYCEEQGIPLVIILGESELEKGVVKLREVTTRKEEEIPKANLLEELQKRLGISST